MSDASVNQVAILTPAGRGAVATLEISGPDALAAVSELLTLATPKPISGRPQDTIIYGRWGGATGEEVVLRRTGGDALEVHCHGGQTAARSIQADLVSRGFRPIEWREWVQSQSPDAIRAAAAAALADATTQRTAAILLDQYNGSLSRSLQSALALLDASQLTPAEDLLRELFHYADLGLHLTRPWRVVLAGPPNVGKSSLINALLGYARSIVFDMPGTTRDVVTARTAFDGWPVELSDTAGLRDSDDELESAGVALATARLSQADLAVLVFDATQEPTTDERELLEHAGKALIVLNKSDLPGAAQRITGAHLISAKTGDGIAELISRIAKHLVPACPAPGAAVLFLAEHVVAIQQALVHIVHGKSSAAAQCLREVLRTIPVGQVIRT